MSRPSYHDSCGFGRAGFSGTGCFVPVPYQRLIFLLDVLPYTGYTHHNQTGKGALPMANRMYAKTVMMTEATAYGYTFAYNHPKGGEK